MRRCTTVYNDAGAEVYSIEIDIPDAVRIKQQGIDPRDALNAASRAAEEEVRRILNRVDAVPEAVTSDEAINSSLAKLAGKYGAEASPGTTTGAHPSDCSCSAYRTYDDTEGIKHV